MTRPGGFGDVIADVARRWPQRPAIEVLDGPAVTYETFDHRTTRLANALLSVAAPGDRIAAWLPTGVEYLEVYGAVAKAGLVLVPVHERFTAGEAAHLLDDSQARVLLHGPPMEERAEQLDPSALNLVVPPERYEAFLSTGGTALPAGPTADDLFLLAYTSGTTGFPKGAMVSHRAVLRGLRVTAMASRLVPYGTQAYASSMSFVPTVTAQILPHLALAGRVLLCGGWDPERVVDAIDRYRATYAYVPTPGLADFAAAVSVSGPHRCPSLATVLHAGSKAPPAALAAAAGALGSRFVEGWGMTENSGFLLTATTAADMAPPEPSADVLVSAGRPVPGAEIDLVADDGTSLPRDGATVGGLRARSATLMRGYWRNDRATTAALAAGWYATGDLGTIDAEGYVTIVDRRDDLILSGGANVYPSELERVIAGLAGVIDVAVVGVD
ncbi:MAG TPA: class I adenylate-forming enzyme family protein, partial [Acidimicrobiia bacterium]|nr:class I adenylate-forming enzyme family protein [Acidimicrobiia bacterium]